MKAISKHTIRVLEAITYPYVLMVKHIGNRVETFFYPPALPDLNAKRIYEKLMMDYIDHPDREMFRDFRGALTDYLNHHPSVSNLDLAMVVRQWFIVNTPVIEHRYKRNGKRTKVVSLKVIQAVTDDVVDYFQYEYVVSTDKGLDKFNLEA